MKRDVVSVLQTPLPQKKPQKNQTQIKKKTPTKHTNSIKLTLAKNSKAHVPPTANGYLT